MLPRRKPSKLGIREDERSYPGHLKFVRGFVCIAFKSGTCEGRIEAHHVREGHTAGTGIKPPDYMVVPCCAQHHAEGHQIGWKTFEAKYGVRLLVGAQQLAKASPHRHLWERTS